MIKKLFCVEERHSYFYKPKNDVRGTTVRFVKLHALQKLLESCKTNQNLAESSITLQTLVNIEDFSDVETGGSDVVNRPCPSIQVLGSNVFLLFFF